MGMSTASLHTQMKQVQQQLSRDKKVEEDIAKLAAAKKNLVSFTVWRKSNCLASALSFPHKKSTKKWSMQNFGLS